MLCWSCGKEIADNAVRCSHCEADVTALPDDEDIEMAREFLETIDPQVRSEIFKVFESSESGEEFVNRIMVGDCPKCGSNKTGDCEHDPDIEDITMGRCFDCGHVWCTVCDAPYTQGQDSCEVCGELDDDVDGWLYDELDEDVQPLDRYHLLAAEIFGYSFDNYRNHLGIDNIRYEQIMPDDARLLERAVTENWSAARVAKAMCEATPTLPGLPALTEKQCQNLLDACRNALHVLDAGTPAESFRNAVRLCIQRALEKGLSDPESVEALVTQICFRASDLSVLLEQNGESLSQYSDDLRREPPLEHIDMHVDDQETDQ